MADRLPTDTTPAPTTGAGPSEWVRKTIHIALTLAAAALLWRAPLLTARALMVTAAVAAVAVEVLRRSSGRAEDTFRVLFGWLMRSREEVGVTGATTLALGLAFTALLFPREPALAGFLYVGLGDAASALIGRRWGRLRWSNGKSLEGSGAFFVTALAVGLWVPGIGAPTAVAAAATLTVIEALTLPVDDNLALPVIGAGIVWAAGLLLRAGGPIIQ